MILLTGATGNVGGAAAAALAARGHAFRVLVRDQNKLAANVRERADIVTGDLTRRNDLVAALAGVQATLLVTPNGEGQADLESEFIDCAAEAGVRHIVKVSSMEAAPNAASAIPLVHYESEQKIRASGMDFTMLRPNFFMQNLLLYAAGIRAAGALSLPLGRARVAMIDARDVGKAAAAALVEPVHRNRCYELSGNALMDFHQVAGILGDRAGAHVAYVEQPLSEFRASLAQFIPSSWHVEALVTLFDTIAHGALSHTSADIEELLGEPANTLERFATEHAAMFAPAENP